MDFAIVVDRGDADMSWNAADSIFNNIFLSLSVRRGSFFHNPQFGSRLHLLRKNTARNESLAESYAKEALQWIIETGRAKRIDVTARRDTTENLSRMKLLVEAEQTDGRIITYNTWIDVI